MTDLPKTFRHGRGVGISTRVLAGLAVIVTCMVATSVLVALTFGRVSESVSAITERDLPSLLTVFRLARESERMEAITPDVIVAGNQFVREALTDEFASGAQQWEKTVRTMRRQRGDIPGIARLVDQSRQLHGNIGSISELVDKRMQVADRMAQINRRIRRLGEKLNSAPARLNGMDKKARADHSRLTQVFNSSIILLLAVNGTSEHEELRRLEKSYRSLRAEMGRLLETVPPDIRNDFNPLFREIIRFGLGDDSIFVLTEHHFGLDKAIENRLIASKFISGGIVDSTNTVLDRIVSDICAVTTTLSGRTAFANYLAIVLPVVTLLCSVLIIIYLRRSVIGRVVRLQRAMIDHVNGEPGPVEVTGNDEISAMGEATNFFIDEIGKREARIRDNEIKYRNLFEMAPVAIFRLDLDNGTVLAANSAAPTLFGFRGKENFRRDFDYRHCFVQKDRLGSFLEELEKAGSVEGFEIAARRPDGETLHLALSAAAYPEAGYVECAAIDMTLIMLARETLRQSHEQLEQRVEERTQEINRQNDLLRLEIQERSAVEEALRESESRFRLLAENLREVLCLADIKTGRLIYANRSFTELFGMDADTFRRSPSRLVERIHPEDRQTILDIIADEWGTDALEKRSLEYRLLMPGDDVKWVLTRVVHIRDAAGAITRATVMAEDITDRKNSEKIIRDSAQRLKYLSTKLIEAQEEERRRLAAELHDNVAPSLGTVKFGMERVINELPPNHRQKETLLTVIGIVKNVVRLIGRIQMELRPSMIDDLGVIEAVDWYCQEYMNIYKHIRVDQRIRTSENMIPERLKIVIYRVIQEALNNIARHSGAETVVLLIESEGTTLRLVIEDNGRGFDPDSVAADKRVGSGLGLVSMRERTELALGEFTLRSSPGRGTLIEGLWDTAQAETPAQN